MKIRQNCDIILKCKQRIGIHVRKAGNFLAEGKIRDTNHIVEAKSLLFLQSVLPIEWVQRKMEPDYGIDIDLELFEHEDGVCVTLGEHVFFQVKGTEYPEFATIKPIGEQLYTKKELEEKKLPVLKFVVDVPLLKLVERMGSAIPVLLVVVDIKEQVAYYACLNDYVHNVLLYRANDYREQDSITIYIPKENVLKPDVVSWYGKRAKLYGLFQELLTLSDNVQYLNANHKVGVMKRHLEKIVKSDAWSVCKRWMALEELRKQLEDMLKSDMVNEAGKRMLDRLVEKGEDPSSKVVQYGSEPTQISALLASQAISCDTFLDQAKAVGAIFENHIRHMGLPTQVNWMISH